MVVTPAGVEVPDDDLLVWQAYEFCCVVHRERWAVCLHEEPPRGLNPHWKEQPWNRFCVCHECHERLHRMGRQEAHELLNDSRRMNYPKAERWLMTLKPTSPDAE